MKVEWITDPTGDAVPLPGVCHPAVEREAALLESLTDRDGRNHYVFPVPPTVRARAVYAPDADVDLGIRQGRVFTRRKAWGSLDRHFGAYVWTVWTDDLGRSAGMDDSTWSPNPQAEPWNPVAP